MFEVTFHSFLTCCALVTRIFLNFFASKMVTTPLYAKVSP